MKRLGVFICLVILLLVPTSAAEVSHASDGEEQVWKAIDFRMDPPEGYSETRYDTGRVITQHVSETSYEHSHSEPARAESISSIGVRSPARDAWTTTHRFEFTPLPDTLVPGETVIIDVSWAIIVTGKVEPGYTQSYCSIEALLFFDDRSTKPGVVLHEGGRSLDRFKLLHEEAPVTKSFRVRIPAIEEDHRSIRIRVEFAAGTRAGWVERVYRLSTVTEDETDSFTLFTGYVLAYDNLNRVFPVRQANVKVRLERGNEVLVAEDFTDHEGSYAVLVKDVTNTTSYQVQVAFAERSGVYQVNWHDELQAATYLTEERQTGQDAIKLDDSNLVLVVASILFEPGMNQGEPMRVLDKGDKIAITRRTVEEDRAAALVYAHSYTAVEFGWDRLGMIYDYKPPLAVSIGGDIGPEAYGGGVEPDNLPGAYYDQDYNRIRLSSDTTQRLLNALSPDLPLWHEFGHFIQQDSLWLRDNFVHRLADPNDTWHGGVENTNSAGSVIEGAAHFIAALIKGVDTRSDNRAPLVWDCGYEEVDLQKNKHELYKDGTTIPYEEYSFAALLWDMMDDDQELEDEVAWGLDKLWDVLEMVKEPSVRAHYEAFKAANGEPLPGPDTPPTAIDRLFILHGFYSDTNRDGEWQQGEPIGYADRWEPKADPRSNWGPNQHPVGVRFVPPTPQFLWLEFDLPKDIPIPSEAELTVYPADGGPPWTMPIIAAENGHFPLGVPSYSERVHVRLLSPGFQITPMEFTRASYEASMKQGTTVVKYTPEVQAIELGSPTNFEQDRQSDKLVNLSWVPVADAAYVVVVRGATHIPVSPQNGIIIYQGTGSSASDSEALPAGSTFYAAFSIGKDGEISMPAAVISEAPIPKDIPVPEEVTSWLSQPDRVLDSGTGRTIWYIVSVSLAVGLLIVVLVLRKRRRG